MSDDRKKNPDNEQNSQTLPDNNTSYELMNCVLGEYLKRHKVVLKKLQIAQQATIESLQEIDKLCERFQLDKNAAEFHKIRQYNDVWKNVIDLYSQNGVTEDEIEQIDGVLQTIPKGIKEYYEAMINKDENLLKQIRELGSKEYLEARKQIKQVQEQPNPVTGLGSEEFDDEYRAEQAKAFKILGSIPDKGCRH